MSVNTRKSRTAEQANRDFLVRAPISAKPTILIVEDHDDSREMLRLLFKTWGCRVVEACNGLEAVEAASRERPALILMDGSLPFLDGLGATRRIRENGLLSEVKIVALNGWGTASYNAAALAAGCNDCLVKPIDFERLRAYLVPLFAESHSAGATPRTTKPKCQSKTSECQ
jgi:CheY-like chemotaxis protein